MRAAALAVLVAVLAAAAVSAPVVVGRASWDEASYQRELAPARRAAAAAVRAGRLPLWWDGAGFGAPLVGEARNAALYPASWASTSGWGVDVVGVLHLVLLGAATSGLAAALWRRRRGAALPASVRGVVAALPAASGLGGAALVGGWVGSLVWLMVALAIVVEWGEGRRRGARLAAALALVGLAGAPELGLVAVVAVGIAMRKTAPRWGLAAALAIGASVSAAQWLPWWQLRQGGVDPRALLATAAVLAMVGAGLALAMSLARGSKLLVGGGALLVAAALGFTLTRTPWRDRAALDEPPAWLAARLPEGLAALRDRGAPLRVFCPPLTLTRDAAAGEPGAPLRTTGTPLRCAQSDAPVEDLLWRRGAGAGGRLLRRLSIPLAIVPSSTVNAVGLQQLSKQGNWALVAMAARPLGAVYPATFAAADARAAVAAVVPPPGQPGAAAAQLVVEGQAALGAAPRPRAAVEEAQAEEAHVAHDHLAHEPVEVTAPLLDGAPPEPCSLLAWRPGEISLSCPALPVPGVAAIASAWAPGWQVSVDGAAAAPLRVEAVLRGVALPASAAATSSHAIVWRYRPPAWPLAAALSLLGLAGLLLTSAWSLRAMLQRHR